MLPCHCHPAVGRKRTGAICFRTWEKAFECRGHEADLFSKLSQYKLRCICSNYVKWFCWSCDTNAAASGQVTSPGRDCEELRSRDRSRFVASFLEFVFRNFVLRWGRRVGQFWGWLSFFEFLNWMGYSRSKSFLEVQRLTMTASVVREMQLFSKISLSSFSEDSFLAHSWCHVELLLRHQINLDRVLRGVNGECHMQLLDTSKLYQWSQRIRTSRLHQAR